jgi:hypothetical protein
VRKRFANIEDDTANIENDTANIEDDATNIENDTANIENDTANIEDDATNIENDTANIENDAANIEDDATNIDVDGVAGVVGAQQPHVFRPTDGLSAAAPLRRCRADTPRRCRAEATSLNARYRRWRWARYLGDAEVIRHAVTVLSSHRRTVSIY